MTPFNISYATNKIDGKFIYFISVFLNLRDKVKC